MLVLAVISIIVHFVLGLGCIGWIIASNPKVYARPAGGPWLSPLECVYYAAGLASGELTWRVRLRTNINHTDDLGVRFRADDIAPEP